MGSSHLRSSTLPDRARPDHLARHAMARRAPDFWRPRLIFHPAIRVRFIRLRGRSARFEIRQLVFQWLSDAGSPCLSARDWPSRNPHQSEIPDEKLRYRRPTHALVSASHLQPVPENLGPFCALNPRPIIEHENPIHIPTDDARR